MNIIFQCVFPSISTPKQNFYVLQISNIKCKSLCYNFFFPPLFKHKNFVLKFKLNCLTDAAHSKVKTKLHTEQSETILEKGNDSFRSQVETVYVIAIG